MKRLKTQRVLWISLIAFWTSCNSGGEKSSTSNVVSKRAGINEVIVHISADAQRLNPITSSEAYATEIQNSIFQPLLTIDHDSFHLLPLIAIARPEIKEVNEGEYAGGLEMTFEIRPEAKWDNGEPIMPSDVEFSIKALKNPHVDAVHSRPYLEFIDDFKVDPNNPRRFTFYCKGRYLLSEISAGTNDIIPEYIYDPDKLMRNFTIKELNDPKNLDKLKGDPRIIEFADKFNSEKFSREPGFVVGSGPYEFVEWTTGQRIILKKKANWWGEPFVGKLPAFNNYPDKLTYEIIVDNTTAVTALKDEGLDAIRSFKTKDYVDLQKDSAFNQLYNMYTPPFIATVYIGLNMRNPKLSDKKVRQALSHALDKKYIMEVYYYNLTEPTIGTIHPSKKYYHRGLKPYEFDLDKAKVLLDEAGWKDTDGDGIRDKMIDGKKVPLKLQFKYSTGSQTAENIGLLFQKNAQQLGVGIELIQREWTVFLEENENHNFEMYFGQWVNNPVPDDPYQLWHTTSYNGGSNYCGFGNEESDKLIEAVRYEMDEAKRHDMYIKFQEIVYDEAPYIFLFAPLKKLAVHKRFKNSEGKATRTGYEVTHFILEPGFGTKAVAAK